MPAQTRAKGFILWTPSIFPGRGSALDPQGLCSPAPPIFWISGNELANHPIRLKRRPDLAVSKRQILWQTGVKAPRLRCVSDVTRVIEAVQRGDPKAADELLPLVYEELRKLAASKMANEAAGNTLQPTALVHEAWLRLVGKDNPKFAGRAHFFAAAAEAMRRILIDRARRKRAVRHGGGQVRVDLEQLDVASPDADDQLLAVNDALDKLAAQDPIEAELVKLRYFAGLTVEDAAALLNISPRTAQNYWAHARTWLYHEINVRDR